MAIPQFAGDLLHVAMRQAGLDDAQLAHELGVSKSCIVLYRLNYRQPPPTRLVQLAAVLDCNVEDFFAERDEKPVATW
jgi:transcriptional regulator with XRE-family HTH domain